MNIWRRLGLSTLSGVICWLIFINFDWGTTSSLLESIYVYGASGLSFAVGVLFPCLHRQSWTTVRAIFLIAISILSYRCAILIVDSGWVSSAAWYPGGGYGPETMDFVAASIVGASIVLIGARVAIPVPHTLRLVTGGLLAAVIGGLIFEGVVLWGIESWDYDLMPLFLSFAVWHVLIAGVIYLGQGNTEVDQLD